MNIIEKQKSVYESVLKARNLSRCFYPGCDAAPIESHVQQLRGSLKVISEGNEVVGLDGLHKLLTFGREMYNDLNAAPRIIGPIKARRATAYPGFCQHHDSCVFQVIERGACLCRGNGEQILALYRRPFFRMLYSIEQSLLVAQDLYEQNNAQVWLQVRNSLMPCYQSLMNYSREVWRGDYHRNLKCVWRIIKAELPVSCACCINLTTKACESFGMSVFPFAVYSLIPERSEAHAVLIWDGQFNAEVNSLARRFATKDNVMLSNVMNELTFARGVDFCVKPTFWKELSVETRTNVEENVRNLIVGRHSELNVPSVISIPPGCIVQ